MPITTCMTVCGCIAYALGRGVRISCGRREDGTLSNFEMIVEPNMTLALIRRRVHTALVGIATTP